MQLWKAIMIRTFALVVDLLVFLTVFVLLSKIPLPNDDRLKWLLIVLFTSVVTTGFGFIFGTIQKFIDKQKNRYDDLVILQRELNRLLISIDGILQT